MEVFLLLFFQKKKRLLFPWRRSAPKLMGVKLGAVVEP
jgi:hypothetical protein